MPRLGPWRRAKARTKHEGHKGHEGQGSGSPCGADCLLFILLRALRPFVASLPVDSLAFHAGRRVGWHVERSMGCRVWVSLSGAAVVVLLSIGCHQSNPIPRLPEAEWALEVVAMRHSRAADEGHELWFILKNTSDRALPLICPSGWGLDGGASARFHPAALGSCDEPADYRPVPPGSSLVHRVLPSETWTEFSQGSSGVVLTFFEKRWPGLGPSDGGQVSWTGTMAQAEENGARLRARDQQPF